MSFPDVFFKVGFLTTNWWFHYEKLVVSLRETIPLLYPFKKEMTQSSLSHFLSNECMEKIHLSFQR